MLMILLPVASIMVLPFLTNLFWFWSTMLLMLLAVITTSTGTQFFTCLSTSPFSNIDTISTTLVTLTMWITAMMLQASLKLLNSSQAPKHFLTITILLLLSLVMCFYSSNLLNFYIWFEASLIPTMLLIMLWGYQPERTQASMYLIMYTVTASLPLLMAICLIYSNNGHMMMNYPTIYTPTNIQPHIMSVIMLLAFLVKLPLFLVHLWLPKAHVEAPVAGSMILAGILLKLGGYGMMRILLMFSPMIKFMNTLIISVAMMGAVITSLMCLRQPDLKSVIAYSSIGHMGLMCAGLMSGYLMGAHGALIMMIAHGFSSSALFCLANTNYEMTHTRSLLLTKGMLSSIPCLSLWWFLLICSNMAAPPSINLLSEILLITASMKFSLILSAPIMLLSFLTAAYSLHVYSSINHGKPLSYYNPLPTYQLSYNLLMTMHLSPIILLIINPTMITT